MAVFVTPVEHYEDYEIVVPDFTLDDLPTTPSRFAKPSDFANQDAYEKHVLECFYSSDFYDEVLISLGPASSLWPLPEGFLIHLTATDLATNLWRMNLPVSVILWQHDYYLAVRDSHPSKQKYLLPAYAAARQPIPALLAHFYERLGDGDKSVAKFYLWDTYNRLKIITDRIWREIDA